MISRFQFNKFQYLINWITVLLVFLCIIITILQNVFKISLTLLDQTYSQHSYDSQAYVYTCIQLLVKYNYYYHDRFENY